MGAARVAWAARSVKGLLSATSTDLVYRTAGLLESANDPSCTSFETSVLRESYSHENGSERHLKAQKRLLALEQASGASTFASKIQEQFAAWSAGFMAWGFFMKPWPCPMADVRSGTSQCRQAALIHGTAANGLTSVPHEQHCLALWWSLNLFFCSSSTCDMDDWDPDLCGGQAALAAALAYYAEDPCGHGKQMKSSAGTPSLDLYRCGTAAALLPLCFGDLPALDQWAEDVVVVYKDLDLPATRKYTEEGGAIIFSRPAFALLIELNRPAAACALFEAMGIVWSDTGFVLYDLAFQASSGVFPGSVKDADVVLQKLLMYLASPQSAALDAEVNAWIPAPAALAQHEREHGWCQHFAFSGILRPAAAAFLRLGRDDDAKEAARILVSPEHHCIMPIDLARGHGVLGQVAAKRGDMEEAGGHLGRAMEAAKASKYPLMEVLTARDWKLAVGASAAAAADAAIDAACAKMGKSREQLASLLL